MDQHYLFQQFDARTLQQHLLETMKAEIANLDGNRLLNSNPEDMVRYLVQKYALEVPELMTDQMTVDSKEAQRDVSNDPTRVVFPGSYRPVYVGGTEIIVELPFSGNPQLLHTRPNEFSSTPPQGTVASNVLVYRQWGDRLKFEQVRATIDAWVRDVQRYLVWHRNSFSVFNPTITATAAQEIERRRNKLLESQNLVSSLGIPMKRRSDSIGTYSAPEVKRKISPTLPPASSGQYRPEPVLEEAEYQHILSVLEGMVTTMERSPKAFHHIDEEGLRTFLLVALNGHYDGKQLAKHLTTPEKPTSSFAPGSATSL